MKRQYVYIAADALIDDIRFYANPFAAAPTFLKGNHTIREMATKIGEIPV